jgi:hypothetical protein
MLVKENSMLVSISNNNAYPTDSKSRIKTNESKEIKLPNIEKADHDDHKKFQLIFNRFMTHTPFSVESRASIGKQESQRFLILDQISKEKRKTTKRDDRYERLVSTLADVKIN